MNFFKTPVKDLTVVHLQELVDTKAQENLRLEYKAQPVPKDDLLKKISSFANTVGGRIVMGIADGPNSTAREVCGIDPQPSFESQVSSWCVQYLYPPLIPAISGPIAIPGKTTVAYVIDVEESELSPHFIEGRLGCWIRINEGSHRFDASLADQAEIQALLNRREQCRKRAEILAARSQERIRQRMLMIPEKIKSAARLATLTARIAPVFPRRPAPPVSELGRVAGESAFGCGGRPFPDTSRGVHSQADSLIYVGPRHHELSFLEVTTFGAVSLTEFLQASKTDARDLDLEDSHVAGLPYIPTNKLLGVTLLAAKFAQGFLLKAGIRGRLQFSLNMEGIRDIGFYLVDEYHRPSGVARSYLDDQAGVSLECPTEELVADWQTLATRLWRELYFALGWLGAFSDKNSWIIDANKKYALRWLGVGEDFLGRTS